MAAKDQDKSKLKKRKQIPGAKPDAASSSPKKPKLLAVKHSKPSTNDSKKPFKRSEHTKPIKGSEHAKSGPKMEKKDPPMSKRERRVNAKVDTRCFGVGFSCIAAVT